MPDKSRYNLEFRPRDYLDPTSSTKIMIANIKGAMRKRMVRDLLTEGDADAKELILNDESITKDKLSDAEREAVGRIHPLFMGGEYLPGYRGQRDRDRSRISKIHHG